MPTEFDFFTIVRVTRDSELRGREGVVLGKSSDERGINYYSVLMYSEKYSAMRTRSFREDELENTGRREKRENIYSGAHLTVKTDPITGHGIIQFPAPDEDESKRPE